MCIPHTHAHTHTRRPVHAAVPSLWKLSVFFRSSPSFVPLHILTLVLSARAPHPDVHKHTLCNLSQEGGGSPTTVPPPPTVPDRAVFTSPSLSLTHSLTLPIVLTLSVFPTHACSVADGTGEGSASVSALFPPPPNPAGSGV